MITHNAFKNTGLIYWEIIGGQIPLNGIAVKYYVVVEGVNFFVSLKLEVPFSWN